MPVNANVTKVETGNLKNSSNVGQLEPVTKRKRRRKVKIKKKKRLLTPKQDVVNTDYLNGLEEHGQEATKPRRKIVITRKRILPNRSKTLANVPIDPTSIEQEIPTTKMLMQNSNFNIQIEKSEIAKHFRENVDRSRVGKNLKLNISNIRVDVDENEDRTEENLIDHDNITEALNYIDDVHDDEDDDNFEEDDDHFENEDEEYDDEDEYDENLTDEDDDEYEDDEEADEEDEEEDEIIEGIKEITKENEKETGKLQDNQENIQEEGLVNEKQDTIDSKNTGEKTENFTSQSLPEYEPFFPELTESTDVPVLLLKTTVVSNIELETKTITTTRLRTYTFVVTRVAGNEEIITSTTEVKPQIKTTIVTESSTLFTTLTLLDLDNMDKTDIQPTFLPTLEYNPSSMSNLEDNPDFREEPRNLATRVMSNGVEVIVAGDKTTYPGDFKRVLPSTQKAVTLKPSTLTDHMLLLLPQETSATVDTPTTPLDPNQFVVKTCLTTFTYLTTYLEKGITTVSSHEQVVSNVATEERMNTGKILPTPAMGITLTQYPTLSVGVFHTTYTYLNTILDGEQPLVISSQHVVANTVTAPDDYLSILNPSELKTPVKDTNTYFSTIDLEKTLYEDGSESVISTREVVTQVVITESIPPRDRPVMTSYIALDMIQDAKPGANKILPSTTDVTKTYFVTYTYFNTIVEDGKPTIYTNISTESDVVTEKVLVQPKNTIINSVTNATNAFENGDSKKEYTKDNVTKENVPKFDILATRIYFTTFTYFTTLLKENDPQSTTIINSRTKVVQNIVTETLEPNLFESQYLSLLSDDLKIGSGSIQKLATLIDGQKIEITVQANDRHNEIKPTKILPIQKTQIPEIEPSTEHSKIITSAHLEGSFSTSKPNIITGSTIVFVDDDPFANLVPTPSLSSATKVNAKKSSSTVKNKLGSLLASEVVKETKINVVTSRVKRPGHKNKHKNKDKVNPTKTSTVVLVSSSSAKIVKKPEKTDKIKKSNHPAKITSVKQPVTPTTDLLGLGSININTLHALTPVLSAMAGYINKNLKTNRRNDVNSTADQPENLIGTQNLKQDSQTKNDYVVPAVDAQNRSPVYIPVGGVEDFEIAESQNIASFDWNESSGQPETQGSLKHEAPLLGNTGIPISPGDIITANSDVIVGKPGRVGPRLPSAIPLHHEANNEVPLGMKPPPVPDKQNNWSNKNKNKNTGQRTQIPVLLDQVPAQTNIIHAPNKDDYVGPPPPPRQTKEKFRGEKRKHIPIGPLRSTEHNNYKPNNFEAENQFKIVQNQQDVLENQYNANYNVHDSSENQFDLRPNGPVSSNNNQVNFGPKHAPQYSGEQPPPYQINPNSENFSQENIALDQSLQETIHKNYELESQKQNIPAVYAAERNPLIVPSIPIVLPEVIERSTGQPLLVQLQPSQVAFVNIPFNRTTALIYGGSTETHHNGQYFDDPSPYPEPEFNPIESFKNGVPQFASVYHDSHQLNQVNQKQVSGVIKVGSQISHAIKVEPDTSANEKVPVHIHPTRPNDPTNGVHFGNAEINVNLPPLSFGMTEQNGDMNAHIINHQGGSIAMQKPSMSFVVYNDTLDKRPVDHPLFNQVRFGAQGQNQFNILTNRQRPNYQNNPVIGTGTVNLQNELPHSNVHLQQNTQNYNNEPTRNLPNNQNDVSQEIRPPPQTIPVYPEEQKPNLQGKPNVPHRSNKPKNPYPPKRNLLRPRPRPDHRPKVEVSEYMSPPPVNKQFGSKRPPFRHGYGPGKDRVPIPLAPEGQQFKTQPNQFNRFEPNQNSQRPLPNLQANSDEVFPVFDSHKLPEFSTHQNVPSNFNQNHNRPGTEEINVNKYHHDNIYKDVDSAANDDLYISDEHLEDDSPNEDGEVVQESNPRPLKPGEIPLEVLRKEQASSTTERGLDLVRFPDSFQNGTQIRFPYHQYPRLEFVLPDAKPFESEDISFEQPKLPVRAPEITFGNHYNGNTKQPSNVPHRGTAEQDPTYVNVNVRQPSNVPHRGTAEQDSTYVNVNVRQPSNVPHRSTAEQDSLYFNINVSPPSNVPHRGTAQQDSKYVSVNVRPPSNVPHRNTAQQDSAYVNVRPTSNVPHRNTAEQDSTYGNVNAKPPSNVQHRGTTDQSIGAVNVITNEPESISQTEINTLNVVNRKPSKSSSQYPPSQFTTESLPKTRGTTNLDNTGQTQKPVLIFIDENGQKNNFFNKKPIRNNRPKVTSLPIDPQTSRLPSTSKTPITLTENYHSQTELPFDSSKYPAKSPTNEINIYLSDKDSTTTSTTESTFTTKRENNVQTIPSILLNSGENFGIEFANLTQQINNMEVLKPPPLVEETLIMPSVSMEPPKIDISSPGQDIERVPHINTISHRGQEEHSTTPQPFVPELSEEMVPPAPVNVPNRPESTVPTTEVVLGMNPPPLVSTHKPIVSGSRPAVAAGSNVFSMEVDIPKEPFTSTKKYDRTRPRVPPFRRPGYRRTTTTPATPLYTSASTTSQRTTPYQGYFKTRTSTTLRPHKMPGILVGDVKAENVPEVSYKSEKTPAASDDDITPTPTLKNTPSMEVIVGQPHFEDKDQKEINDQDKAPSEENNDSNIKLNYPNAVGSSQAPSSSTQATPELIITVPQDLNHIITKPVHHAGNEIKIVDEPDTSPKKSIIATNSPKESKSALLPTRYITHTKTHTVTITKTTVVKTLGGPPSTLTLLVTKTEKSYIVDTVTEFHTLVKPTNIVETVTTTIQKENSLYASDVNQSSYPIVPVRPSAVVPTDAKPSVVTAHEESPTIISSGVDLGFDNDKYEEDDDDDSLEDFIIKDSDNFGSQENAQESYDSNESIFVVMTDKNKGTIVKIPPQTQEKSKTTAPPDHSNDPPHRDEIRDNEVNNVLLGGILIANHPAVNSPVVVDDKNKDRCTPDCKPSRNELCQKVEGVMRCVCRPGFARMFPDRPCNPTYTYSMNITIDKFGKSPAKYSEKLSMENSTEFALLARKVHEALDRMVMQSDLRDVYHGVHVTSFYPSKSRSNVENGVVSKFYLQLSDNIDEFRMEDIFKKYLRNNNYSLGGTDVIASMQTIEHLKAQDFNECENPKFHDCSENAKCFNLKGTYTCSCKEGYSDLSENMLYPGRICSAEQVGCEKCNYHGTCYSRGSEEILCECFHWYAGEYCQINLKVLLIALVTLGTILFALLLVCIILTCVRRKPNKSGVAGAMGFLPQRVGNGANRGETLDRRAMIEDTSSEDSRSETNSVPPYVQQKQPKLKPPPPKGALKKVSKVSMTSVEHSEPGIIFPDQKDRSLTVMIPRAKYHPATSTSPLMNYTTFDARKPSVPSVNPESKLLSYLDAGPSPSKSEPKRKYSNAISEQFIEEKPNSRKTSGALISAGFEVSATVINTMGTLGTTYGTEADRSENATLIHKISADLMSRADTSSQFNTLRKSLVDDDLESSSNWMDIPRISTVSESRSYDETTIPPPMKSFTRSEYDTKSLQHQNDEANTMAERDLGSTFLLPHTHLYKADRGSDISGFESL